MDFRNTTRREFLLAATAAAIGLSYSGPQELDGPLGLVCDDGPFFTPACAAAPVRKIVTIGARRARIIDIHAHCVIPAVNAVIRGTNVAIPNPELQEIQLLSPARIQAMDARGIDIAALSINTYWWYSADLAARIVRTHDEGLAAWCREHPDRFVGLTSVALQHPELAAEQLDHAVRNLGLRGASIAGSVLGEAPTTEKFDPFWRKAEELQVPVFMHPLNGQYTAAMGVLGGNGDLPNIIGNPLDTTLFLTKLIYDGVFDRFPRLKVCGSHGGGYLPSYFGRSEIACQVRPNVRCANGKPPSEYLKSNILVDGMVFSDEGLRHLVAVMGARQIVFGSDMPFNWPDMTDLVVSASWLGDADKLAILGGNLATLLKLPA